MVQKFLQRGWKLYRRNCLRLWALALVCFGIQCAGLCALQLLFRQGLLAMTFTIPFLLACYPMSLGMHDACIAAVEGDRPRLGMLFSPYLDNQYSAKACVVQLLGHGSYYMLFLLGWLVQWAAYGAGSGLLYFIAMVLYIAAFLVPLAVRFAVFPIVTDLALYHAKPLPNLFSNAFASLEGKRRDLFQLSFWLLLGYLVLWLCPTFVQGLFGWAQPLVVWQYAAVFVLHVLISPYLLLCETQFALYTLGKLPLDYAGVLERQ